VKAKSKEEAQIIELLQSGHTTSTKLIQASGLSAAKFANIISLMEITGKIRNLGAGHWALRGVPVGSKAPAKQKTTRST
jgi:hypothetical protein